MASSDTIFALSSGPGRSGVAVFRVSGENSDHIVAQLAPGPLPQPRKAVFRKLATKDGEPLDEGLVIRFKSPKSFTGEDLIEFQTHGSPAVIEAMASALTQAGAREALPGEFTRRAFENGKMDLTEAEGLADLIDSDSQVQRAQALRQMQGGLRDEYLSWRDNLIDVLAAIEGEIDFPDEQDVPNELAHVGYKPLAETVSKMRSLLEDGFRGEKIRHGLDIAIIGPPNAGKSSLINFLTGRDTAIVSHTAGTTRDIVDAHFELAGLPVRIADTAGLRETQDEIEAEGVRRAIKRSEDCELRIGVVTPEDVDTETLNLLNNNDILLINKIDIEENTHANLANRKHFQVSLKTREGLDVFQEELRNKVRSEFSMSSSPGLTRARHRDCVSRAVEALERAINNLVVAPELSGDDVRVALHAIKELAGETDIEAVLDAIFSRFCVGK